MNVRLPTEPIDPDPCLDTLEAIDRLNRESRAELRRLEAERTQMRRDLEVARLKREHISPFKDRS